MSGMAVRTLDLGVFCDFLLKHVGNVVVTARTNRRVRVFAVRYLRRLVYRVAEHTVLHRELHGRAVRLVANIAGRDEAVLVGMAIGAGHIRLVFARKIHYFIPLFGMTLRAGPFSRHGNLQGFMGVCMAVQTGSQIFGFSVKRPPAST